MTLTFYFCFSLNPSRLSKDPMILTRVFTDYFFVLVYSVCISNYLLYVVFIHSDLKQTILKIERKKVHKRMQ